MKFDPRCFVLLPSRLGPISTIWIGCVLQFCGYAGMYIAATRHLPVDHLAGLHACQWSSWCHLLCFCSVHSDITLLFD